MGLNKLADLVKNDELISQLESIQSNNVGIPTVVNKVYDLLDDESMVYHLIKDKDKIAMAYMIKALYTACFDITVENVINEQHFKYGRHTIYNVEAAEGLRPATKKEVELGIEGLIPQDIYPAGERSHKLISLALWISTGKAFYYRAAGYNLEYDAGGRLTTTIYEMLTTSCVDLGDMVKWLNSGEYKKAISIINKFKRNGAFKYADYAKDEIYEAISVKQLIQNIDTKFPRNSDNKDYRKAIAYVIKYKKNVTKLNPYEISELRTIYRVFTEEQSNTVSQPKSEIEGLREKCERIETANLAGLLPNNSFVFKVISTLKKGKYLNCSLKQMKFIDEAIETLDNLPSNQVKNEVISEDEIDDTLSRLEGSLIDGMFN